MGEVDRAGKSKSPVIVHRRVRLMWSLGVHIYFTTHNVQRVWPPPKAAAGKAPLILALRPVGRWLKLGKKCWDEGDGMLLGRTGTLLEFAVPFIEFAAGEWHSSTLLGYREQHSCVLLSQVCFCLISGVDS